VISIAHSPSVFTSGSAPFGSANRLAALKSHVLNAAATKDEVSLSVVENHVAMFVMTVPRKLNAVVTASVVEVALVVVPFVVVNPAPAKVTLSPVCVRVASPLSQLMTAPSPR